MRPHINTTPININNAKLGTIVKNYYICIDKKLKTSRIKNKFIDLVLKNKYGTIYGKIWTNVDLFIDLFEVNDIVAIKGICEEFNGMRELKVCSINKVVDDYYDLYGYSLSSILLTKDDDVNVNLDMMSKYFNYLDKGFYDIIVPIYHEHFKNMSKIPLTVSSQFSYQKGYILYIWKMLQASDSFKNQSNVRYSMLLTCIFIHEIGKIKYFDCCDGFRVTKAGQSLGSTALGIDLINEYGEKVESNKSTLDKLCNIVIYFDKLYNQVEDIDIFLNVSEVIALYRVYQTVIDDK